MSYVNTVILTYIPPIFDLFFDSASEAHGRWPKASHSHATMPVARDNSNHTGKPMNIQQPCEPAPAFYGVDRCVNFDDGKLDIKTSVLHFTRCRLLIPLGNSWSQCVSRGFRLTGRC